jgi:DNA-binding response OmpR family regulator
MPPRPIRILVLEDMIELAKLLAKNLVLRGLEVELAHDGATALKLLQERTFQLALIDINLPDMSGFDVVSRARASGLLPDTSILFCTGGDLEERLRRAAQFPGSQFISKPFTIKKLLGTITDALRAGEPPAE